MYSELCIEIGEGIEAMGVIEPALIFTVTAFDLTVVAWCVRANQLVLDTKVSSSLLKKSETLAA